MEELKEEKKKMTARVMYSRSRRGVPVLGTYCMEKGPATYPSFLLFPPLPAIIILLFLLLSMDYDFTFLTISNLPTTLNISPDPWERIRQTTSI